MIDKRKHELVSMGRYIGNQTAKKLIEAGFTESPASTRLCHHGCYDGGLFDHSLSVTEMLLSMTRRMGLKWSRVASPYIIGMLHDLCKIDQYRKIEDPVGDKLYEFVQTEIEGHGSKSVVYAKRLLLLTEEEEYCIRWHMGSFGSAEEQNGYSEAVKQYPNVLWTHTADMWSSHVKGK